MVARSDLEVRVQGKDELSNVFSDLQSKTIRFVGAVSSALTAFQIAAFPVESIRRFEKELAGVQKTTNFTDGQIKQLSESLVDLSRNINVSAADLAKIAAAAGQQGLGREGVAGVVQFTESVSRMAAVLDLSVEQAGTDVGKIASIFAVPLKDIERAVSAFNEASNNSTASGEQLLDVVKRIGDAAGSLDLSQSIGLAATGIDLGLSPEVVGTSFSKVMSEMYAQADKFAKLLGVSVEDWIKSLQTNGIDALKQYLAALRKLTPQAQQEQIKQLSGGGRIGVAVTKLVRDAEDSILDFNVANAATGYETGISALKEQLTVLKTLDAEGDKLKNSFDALGTEAGERFVEPLSEGLAQLNAALASDGVLKFARDVGDAFRDIIEAVSDTVKFLANLNVNWTNFIKVAEVFVELKLAQVFVGILGNVTGLSSAFAALGRSAAAAGEAQVAAGNAGSSGLRAAIAQTKELIAAQQAKNQAVREEAALRAQVAQNEAKQAAAEAAADAARGAVAAGKVDTAVAGNAVTAAKSNVAAAEAAAVAARLQVQQQANARLERAEQEHNARIVAIENERTRLQSIAREEGNRSALLAATRARNEQLAAEEAYYAKSLTGINSYYARRLATVTASGQAEVNASRLALAQSLSAFDGAAAGVGMPALEAEARKAAAALDVANKNLVTATTNLTLAQRASAAAAAGMNLFSRGVSIAAAALRGLVAIAGKAFFWLTVIYTVLDATGVLENAGKWFEKLTDFMGLTSAASRDLAVKKEAEAERLTKAARAAEENAKALDALLDSTTGLISEGAGKKLLAQLGSDDIEVYRKGVSELVGAVSSAQDKLNALKETGTSLPVDEQAIREETAKAVALLAERQAELKSAQDRYGSSAERGDYGSSLAIKEAQDAADAQQRIVTDLQSSLARISDEAKNAIATGVTQTTQNLDNLKKTLSDTFSNESAGLFTEFAPQIIESMKKVEEAQDNLQAKTAAYEQDRSEANQEAARQALDQQRIANETSAQVLQNAGAAIAELKAKGGLSEAVVGSLDTLMNFFNLTKEQMANLLKTVDELRKSGASFNAGLVSPKPTAPSGTGTADTQTEAQARRLRRARIELARNELQSIANLEKEANQQRQDEDEDAFKENLTSFEEFYAARLAIEKSNIDIQIRLRQNELGTLNEELAKAKEESEKIQTQAQIVKAQGDIDLLQKQRGALAAQVNRDMRDAVRDFTDQVAEQKLALQEFFGNGTDQEAYAASLQVAENGYRDFVNRLRVQAKDMPELLPLIDEIELKGKFEAVQAGLDAVSRRAQISSDAISIQQRRIQSLQDAGLLTNSQAAKQQENQRKELIQTQTVAVEAMEARLAAMVRENGAVVQTTDQYKELANEIAGRKQDIEDLKLTANEVSKQINEDFQGNIKQLFLDLSNNGDIKDAFADFFLNVVNSLQDTAAEELSQSFVRAIGSIGDGGLGGIFSKLAGMATGGGEDTSALGALGNLAGQATDVLGSSPATPIYTRDADSTLGLGTDGVLGSLAGKEDDAVGDAVESTADIADKGFFSDTFESLGETFTGGISNLYSGITSLGVTIVNGVGSGLTSLMSVFQVVGNAIVAAIFTSAASESTSSAFSSMGAFVGGAAHNGGIAGRLTMRRTGVDNSVFAGAVRYHTGGEAGLAPDEVPAILQKGEEVLTKEDPRHADNLGTGATGSDQVAVQPIFRVQPVLSEDAILDSLKGSKGEKLLLVHIGKNPNAFRQALKL